MQEEAQTKKGGKVNPKKEQELTNELQELNKPGAKGFIFVGFPRNTNQAKLFQKGMIPQELSNPTSVSKEVKQVRLLSSNLVEPKKIVWPVSSALDGVLIVDISRTECKQRGLTRKKKEDKDEYWFEAFGKKLENEEEKLIDAPDRKSVV